MLSFSVDKFPEGPHAVAETAVPLGCVAQPLTRIDNSAVCDDDAHAIGRCASCGAYMNQFNELLRYEWRCSLCGALTAFEKRYTGQGARREHLELQEHMYEADFAISESDEALDDSWPPVYIAVVDGAAGADFEEVVRAALHSALSALPADALFGLLVFSDTLGIYLLSGGRPHVRHVPIPSQGEPLSLLDAVGIERMLVHVGEPGEGRAGITAAIESLGRSPDFTNDAPANRPNGLGVVLRSLVDVLGSVASLAPPRLLLFLGSRPNYGAGALSQEPWGHDK